MADKTERLVGDSEEVDDETWSRMGLRERYRLYFSRRSASNYTMPVFLVAALYSSVGLVWAAGYYWLAMNRSESIFSPGNARIFIVYNVLHGVCGLGATCGPLGLKNRVPFCACLLTFLTPGTMCSPLLPGLVGCLQRTPCKRSIVAVLAFAAYFVALVRAMVDPSEARVAIALAALGVASLFDTIVFFASRGEHYGYHLICLMFPDWIAGCQWVQLMMYIFAGGAKMGPWFKYVVQVLVKDAIITPCLPKHTLPRLFYRDWPRDLSPSVLPRALHFFGIVLEWIFPLCCLATAGSAVNSFGVYGMTLYHAFIVATLPTASVFEWQYYCIYTNMFLYGHHNFSIPSSPGLIVFLLVALFIIPIIGHIWPQLVPFLMAYRQYAGNWRMGVWIVRKSAVQKLLRIKTYNGLLWFDEAPPELGGARADYSLLATFMEVPQIRGVPSMLEKFLEDEQASPDDFVFLNTIAVCNAMFGWDGAVGWTSMRECMRQGILDVCGFSPKEAYWLMIQPSSILPPHIVKYQLVDVTKGPQDAEVFIEVAYQELEGTHPIEVYLDRSKMKRGNSIKGTFLSTYY
mmetsp:Transcript_160231/g.509996  ORF Transcript_160231/g.509996 Transcript_160231/m.509996 type:complete len:573 (+) Transcript_160231:56-1774(+)